MALRGKKAQQESQEEKVIEINAQMQGSLSFQDEVNLKINGNFNGSLDSRGTLTIGQTAQVDANIKGENIVIAGRVKGDITATKMLILMPTAVLHGDIKCPKINIVEGAVFQGRCQMSDNLLDIDEVSKYLEIDVPEIENLANSGKIPATRSGNTWKFERRLIDSWAAGETLR